MKTVIKEKKRCYLALRKFEDEENLAKFKEFKTKTKWREAKLKEFKRC